MSFKRDYDSSFQSSSQEYSNPVISNVNDTPPKSKHSEKQALGDDQVVEAPWIVSKIGNTYCAWINLSEEI